MTSKSRSEHLRDTGNPARAHGKPGRLARWRTLLREDIQSVYDHDPAARGLLEVVATYPGLHAIWLHRISHRLWRRGHLLASRVLSHFGRFFTGVEIHPGARIGRRFFIDHGSGVVIGETARVGDDVLMYTGAILGGTSSERVKRHPTIEDGVVIGSHGVVLGNIRVGRGAKVGSGSVVVEAVPPGATVVGVPGRIVRINGKRLPQEVPEPLDHGRLPDPVVETLRCLVDRVELLEDQIWRQAQLSPVDLSASVPLSCTWLKDVKGSRTT